MLSDQLRRALAARAKRGTLEELGKEWGVDPTVLGRFLRGQRGLNTETSDRICQGLGLVLAPEAGLGGFEAAMTREQKESQVRLVADTVSALRKMAVNLRDDAARLEQMADELGSG